MRELAGLVVLNLAYLGAGLTLLWGAFRVDAGNALARLAGVAYLLGLGTTVTVGGLLLVAGVPYGGVAIVLVLVATAGAGLAAGLARGLSLPRFQRPRRPPEPLYRLGLALSALVVAYALALVQLAPRIGIWEPDAWTFWTPKALAIWRFGELHEQTFTTLPGPTYPLFLPTMEASAIHAMGGFDALAIHLQWAFLGVGFLGAVSGLLRPRVPLVAVSATLLLLVVAPEFNYRALGPLADFPLDYYFALAALATALWIEAGDRRYLAGAGVSVAVAMGVKREGLLLALALLLAALLATAATRRRSWPPLVGVFGLAAATTIPWRVWWNTHGLTGEAPASRAAELARDVDRILPSLWLLLGRLSWQQWLVLVVVPVAAAVTLVATGGPRRSAVLYLATMALGLAAFTWVFWAVPELPTDPDGESPAPRAMASLALLSAAFAPLLLAQLAGLYRPVAEERSPPASGPALEQPAVEAVDVVH